MAYLDRLLAPYRAALIGTPATEGNLSQDPLYASLFAQAMPTTQPGGGGGPVPRGPGGGILELLYGPDVPGHASHLHLAAKNVLPILDRISSMPGFSVGENKFFGGVAPVHVDSSYHYRGKSGQVRPDKQGRMAADINYAGGGRFENESQALQWLENWINRKYG